jgi:glycosyltransferase involved in cell wall biosynthesis
MERGFVSKVSIVLPTYQHGSMLSRALASLAAQTIPDFEVIVVDDGSTDDTQRVLDVWRECPWVTSLRSEANEGAAKAINLGMEHASSPIRTWVSADNIMLPYWLGRLLDEMHDDVGVAYSAYVRFGGARRLNGKQGELWVPGKLIGTLACFFGPSFLITREVWEETGPMRGKISCDYDHWLRIEETCERLGKRNVYVDEVLCRYYAGPQRSSVRDAGEYDARHWQAEARKRRGMTHA